MRRIILICVLVLLANAVEHIGTILKYKINHDQVHEFIHKHSHNSSLKSCSDYEQKLKNATTRMRECIHTKFDPDRKSFCHFMHQDFRFCTDPPRKLLQECLPKKSKDLPSLLTDMVFSGFDYICAAKGSELLELTQPCITHSISDKNDNECRNIMEMKLLEFSQQVPSKVEFCDFHQFIRNCLEKRLEQHCASFITRKNFLQFYDAFGKPCKILIANIK